MKRTYKQIFNAKYNQDLDQPNSLEDIARLTGYKLSGLQVIFNKGIGAFKTNPASVRPNVKSPEQWGFERGEGAFYNNPQSVRKGITNPQQWAYARLYASVNENSKAHKVDKMFLIKRREIF